MMLRIVCVFVAMLLCLAGSEAWGGMSSVKLGGMEVCSLPDAEGESPTSLLIGATEEQLAQFFPRGKLPSQILAFLVKLPGHTVLFDAGLGAAKGGKVMEGLREAGVAPSDVSAILLTHLHGDHYGGLTDAEGRAAFPRAEVWVSRVEKDWWLNEKKDENVRKAFALYEGRLHTFESGDSPLPGVTALDASGHTPGHTAFHVRAEGGELLVVGDLLHFADIQLPLPQIAVTYDVDPVKAPEARRRILNMAAEGGIPVAGMHFTLPGLWRVAKDGDGYAKSPVK